MNFLSRGSDGFDDVCLLLVVFKQYIKDIDNGHVWRTSHLGKLVSFFNPFADI